MLQSKRLLFFLLAVNISIRNADMGATEGTVSGWGHERGVRCTFDIAVFLRNALSEGWDGVL